ncbi:MAG: zinc ribbon domain-containing protein [Lacisediminihabitans sp.]
MEICANCAAKLDPSWKFCTKCGTPVPASTAHETRGEPKAVEEASPAAAATASAVKAVTPLERHPEQSATSKPAPARKPRRAKSNFAQHTPPAPVAAETDASAESAPAAPQSVKTETTVEPILTPESTRAEPALPSIVLQGSEQPEHKNSMKATAATLTETMTATPSIHDDNPFSHDLPSRPEQPQTRSEAKAAAAVRAATGARTMTEAKADIRAKYPIPSASSDNARLEYTEDAPVVFRSQNAPSKRKIDVPLIVSISLSTAGVVLIVYLAILVFGARG